VYHAQLLTTVHRVKTIINGMGPEVSVGVKAISALLQL
jgi:hypothetical protein